MKRFLFTSVIKVVMLSVKKSLGCLILIPMCTVLICGCIDFQRDFEIHEWGVFVRGYDCNGTSVLGKPPDIIFSVRKPVIYFHNSGKMKVLIDIANIDNVTTIPPADVIKNHIVWFVSIDSGYVVLPNGTRYPYLFYEGTINWSTNVKADIRVKGSNATFHVKNGENYTISDVYLVYGYPLGKANYTDMGLTYIRVDKVDGGEEVSITVELRNETSFDVDELVQSLIEKGLTEKEAREMVNYWKEWWFHPTDNESYTRLIYIIPQHIYDEILPLTVLPPPSSSVRVGVVTITDIPVTIEIQ